MKGHKITSSMPRCWQAAQTWQSQHGETLDSLKLQWPKPWHEMAFKKRKPNAKVNGRPCEAWTSLLNDRLGWGEKQRTMHGNQRCCVHLCVAYAWRDSLLLELPGILPEAPATVNYQFGALAAEGRAAHLTRA